METVHVDTGTGWTHQFCCGRCGTVAIAAAGDLEADEFKISGHHFDGTAVCARRLYLVCPTCDQLHFLEPEIVAEIPYLLDEQADANYRRRRAARVASS
jgi:hypothetical protein